MALQWPCDWFVLRRDPNDTGAHHLLHRSSPPPRPRPPLPPYVKVGTLMRIRDTGHFGPSVLPTLQRPSLSLAVVGTEPPNASATLRQPFPRSNTAWTHACTRSFIDATHAGTSRTGLLRESPMSRSLPTVQALSRRLPGQLHIGLCIMCDLHHSGWRVPE